MLKEFREFAMKGNVVDLAVGFILGAAFGTIVTSLVNDVLMPPIGLVLGNVDFAALRYVLQEEARTAAGEVATPEVAIRYGVFINHVISFVIVALAMFMIVKAMNTVKRKEEAAPAAVAEVPPQEKLLAEIRDLLARRP